MIEFLLLLLGLVILVVAGDWLVRGAVNLSIRLGIPALIVSLTIVALGTSAPEFLVSIDAVLKGLPGIAIGNVVGSNIANVLLVLGLPALIFGLNTAQSQTRSMYLQMLVGTGIFCGFAASGSIGLIQSIMLLGVFFTFMGHEIFRARRQRLLDGAALAATVGGIADPRMKWRWIIALIVASLIGLPLGADLLVTNASHIARNLGISDTVIGLTVVAVGTSLPELATTLAAAFRREADVALGNVIGSNSANLLAIIGAAGLFGTIPIDEGVLGFDLWVMVAASLLLVPFVVLKMNMTRPWGLFFIALYSGYVAWTFA